MRVHSDSCFLCDANISDQKIAKSDACKGSTCPDFAQQLRPCLGLDRGCYYSGLKTTRKGTFQEQPELGPGKECSGALCSFSELSWGN